MENFNQFCTGRLETLQQAIYLLLINNYISVPIDDYGVIPDELERIIEANKDYVSRKLNDRKPYWGMIYAHAAFQNPSGICLLPGQLNNMTL